MISAMTRHEIQILRAVGMAETAVAGQTGAQNDVPFLRLRPAVVLAARSVRQAGGHSRRPLYLALTRQ